MSCADGQDVGEEGTSLASYPELTITGDNKGKQPEEGGWVGKALEKETGFNLEYVKKSFMEAKKSFIEASTSGI